ncbi:hypothetical protein P12x_003048 [Tundrisphaera lichenicola]|uniref:hypothetical protein n=1 Tax=Tundrisphaera lichenicola TaxID=2029860 RepID=UPI003EBA90B5
MPLLDDPWLPAPDGDGKIPAVRPAIPVAVSRFDGDSTFEPLPNVQCLWIEEREGTDPGRAGFRYNLASGLEGAPASIEEALGTGFAGALAVNAGDRLVVRATLPDGSTEDLFDGIAVDFGLGLEPEVEEATISAIGIAWRLWDAPIGGASFRDSIDPVTVNDVETDLVAHFNPDGLPNCIVEDAEMAGTISGSIDSRYPTFFDPLVLRDEVLPSFWTLPKAIRYLLFLENPDETYVINPDGATLDALLVDPDGDPIVVPDLPVTGKDLPGTVYSLIREVGFGMKFELATEDGKPRTDLVLFKQQGGDVKHLYLGSRGTPFDPTLFNFNASSLHRDVSEVANQWIVKGGLDRHEAGFVLAPGFAPAPADSASTGAIKEFESSDDGFDSGNRDKYRLYVFDETGEGHWDFATSTTVDTPPSLDAILGAPVESKPQYVRRRRPGIGELITRDEKGKPYRARLAISTDYAGAKPGVWDGTGTWQPVTTTTWRLLPDRLGIELTDTNPNKWEIGPKKSSDTPFPSGVVNGVERQSKAGATRFHIRLTCVIEGDKCVEGLAERTDDSPLPQIIERLVDASDRYRNETVHSPSDFNRPSGPDGSGGIISGTDPIVARDDKPRADAEALAIRTATEAGVLEGPVVIPRLTRYYKIGDRIASIEGRGLGFRTDAGTGDPIYPVVVARRFEFSGDSQSTTIETSDAGTDRRRYSRKLRRRRDGL